MMWVIVGGILAIEASLPILWWTVRKSLEGVWYLVTQTMAGRKEQRLTAAQALELVKERELQIAHISDEIREIKEHLKELDSAGALGHAEALGHA
jgi:hypothetical protein